MLGEIAFDHPLFASLAGAQFNDFTKIRFWKYRRIDADRLGEARVLARFENGDAAVVEKLIGKGRLVVLASGWQPADSQLARSSKFVPLMSALLESSKPAAGDRRQSARRRPGAACSLRMTPSRAWSSASRTGRRHDRSPDRGSSTKRINPALHSRHAGGDIVVRRQP